jgi:ABC-type branched-subunit amino acid transport system substrate-binding protein
VPARRVASIGLPSRVEGAVRAAVLLPLSGRDAALGRALLEAAEMAVFDFGDRRFLLIPHDTEVAGPAVAAEHALADGARILLGPLFGRQVPEVAAIARPRGVPVISFSNDTAVAQPGVYTLGLSPVQAIERVVRYAHGQKLGKFAALLPSDTLGDRVDAGLRRMAGELGASVVRVERYGAAAVDVGAEARALAVAAGTSTGGARRGQAAIDAAQAAARRPLEIEAVVMVEAAGRLAQIAPQLPFYDVDTTRIRLIGTQAWDDPGLGREPALANAWFATVDPEARVAFDKRFGEAFGRPPPRIATVVYDAVGVAAVLARQPNGPDFSQAALTQPSGFFGADGLFRLRPDGTAERGLAVMQIVPRGGVRVLEPAPASFETPAGS